MPLRERVARLDRTQRQRLRRLLDPVDAIDFVDERLTIRRWPPVGGAWGPTSSWVAWPVGRDHPGAGDVVPIRTVTGECALVRLLEDVLDVIIEDSRHQILGLACALVARCAACAGIGAVPLPWGISRPCGECAGTGMGQASPRLVPVRRCGCTDDWACSDGGMPCHWVEADLCSRCALETAGMAQ